MIAVIPVRFTGTSASRLWSRRLLENWMRPLIPFSLGDYWFKSSMGKFDVRHTIYDPIVLDDPRNSVVGGNDVIRPALVNGCIKAASEQVSPDWEATDIVLLWFAQATDAFGGGSADVPLANGSKKRVRTTVLDIESTFGICCQELGHAFDLAHEVDAAGNDYASPYSCMSARTNALEGARVSDPRLPDGDPIRSASDAFFQRPAQLVFTPLLPAAQMVRYPAFGETSQVLRLGTSYATKPLRVRLHALDHRVRTEQPPALVALFTSHKGDGREFAVEFRPGGDGYESAIRSANAGLVVHSYNADGRVRYDGLAPLTDFAEMNDWPHVGGDFALRIESVGPGNQFIDFTILAGAKRRFPIRGVLLAGAFRTQRELNAMSRDDMRNTLIVELAAHSNQSDYQRFDNETLAGMGAAMVLLRDARIRTVPELRQMSAEDHRNTLIVEIGVQTGRGSELQSRSTMDLVLTALGSDIVNRGVSLTSEPSYLRGVLLGGPFRSQPELNRMSAEDHRNTLIVEMAKHSNQTNYQSFDNATLQGVGAVMTTLRRARIRTDAELRQMSTQDQRNTLIVELGAQTGKAIAELQGLSNLDLVLAALGVEPA